MRWVFIAQLYIIIAFFISCAPREFDPADPQGSFALAKEPYDDEYFQEAINKLGEFKSRFPYSRYTIEAELLIADSYFQLSQYMEAAVAYEQFAKLHPKHEKVDFALFRVGEAYWQQAPDDIDREQDFTKSAIQEWQKLIARLPDSPYSVKAREFVQQGRKRIAASEAFIVRFYCKVRRYDACAYRAIALMEQFPEFTDLRLQALEHAVSALKKVADNKEKNADSDKNLYHKTMSAQEIREKAQNFERLLAEFKKSKKS